MLATNARQAVPVFFLKATTKKQVFVPTYTRGDGVTVEGHYASVHVSADFDSHKVLAGNGSASQKQAHTRLARHDWFHALPHAHKAAVLLEHATDIQDKASAASVLSTFRKAVLAGKKPTPSQWRAFETADPDKQRALVQDFRAADKLDALPEPYRNLQPPAAKPEKRVAPAAPRKPKPAPASSADPLAAHLDDIDSAKLPESNSNARVVNGKLDAIAAALKAGDPAVLTMMSYGTNNYAKKAVSLANHALELLGSSERVAPGHKGTPGFRTDAQIAAGKARAKASRTVDAEKDSMFTAIAKLGGLSAADVKKEWGFGKNDLKGYAVGIKPVFSSSKGLTIERMAESLHELGYLQSEDHTELEELVSNSMAGSEHFTPQGYANKAQVDYDEQYQGLTAQDAHETGFDDLPPEAQDHIEEFLDENPDFTDAELESFGRTLELDDSDVPFDLDFGTEESGDQDFGQPHAPPRKGGEPGDDVPF